MCSLRDALEREGLFLAHLHSSMNRAVVSAPDPLNAAMVVGPELVETQQQINAAIVTGCFIVALLSAKEFYEFAKRELREAIEDGRLTEYPGRPEDIALAADRLALMNFPGAPAAA